MGSISWPKRQARLPWGHLRFADSAGRWGKPKTIQDPSRPRVNADKRQDMARAADTAQAGFPPEHFFSPVCRRRNAFFIRVHPRLSVACL